MVSNPEFLKEGAAVADCMRPDRIVIGTSDPETEELLREVYAPFNRNHDKIIVMDVRSAELTKYAANCMLATKISFMNEIAGLAERLGADVEMVRQGIGADQRIGYHFIYPGAGYGGSCFPKDVKALIHTARAVGFEPKLLAAVEDRNDAQKTVLFEKIAQHFDGDARRADLRALGPRLQAQHRRHARGGQPGADGGALGRRREGAGLRPRGDGGGAAHLRRPRRILLLCGTKEAALQGAPTRWSSITEWQAFRAPDFELIAERLKAPVIFDGRNLFDPERMARRRLRLLRHRARRTTPRRDAGVKVLVTGNAGFIGFHVARALLARGDAVVGFDVVNDYYDPALKAARLAELDRAGRRDRQRLTSSAAPTSPIAPRWRPPSPSTASTG